jgi:hypothetical protein
MRDSQRFRKSYWWNWDGSTNFKSHYRSAAIVVDDLGEQRFVHRCSRCRGWFEASTEHFYPAERSKSGQVLKWHSFCRSCFGVRRKAWIAAKPVNELKEHYRKHYESVRSTPERAERRRAKNREAQRRYRKTAAYKATKKRYRDKVSQDPVKRAREAESRRMRERLRREKQGYELVVHDRDVQSHPGSEMIVGPLRDVVLRRVNEEIGEEDYAAVVGVTARTLNRWKKPHAVTRSGDVDAALCAMNLNWWDVYEKPKNGHKDGRPEDVLRYIADAEVYVAACIAFEGELV